MLTWSKVSRMISPGGNAWRPFIKAATGKREFHTGLAGFTSFPRGSFENPLLDKSSEQLSKFEFQRIRPIFPGESTSAFFHPLLAKVTNHVMRKGKKRLARNIMENTFCEIKRLQLARARAGETQIDTNPYSLLEKAVDNSRPFLQTTKVKRGGHTYQVPIPIRPLASQALAINWLIEAGKEKGDDVRFYRQFAREIIEAAEGKGKVIKRKQDLHRLCEANRAYAHYRWG